MSDESDRNKRVETSVSVYRLRLAALPGGAVVFGWDYPGSTLLRVRILRAPAEPALATQPEAASGASGAAALAPEPASGASAAAALAPEPGPDTSWQIVYEGDTGSFRDHDLPPGAWRYAVFARDGAGPWTLWRDEVVTLP